jgi:hypothetical protein
VIVIASGAGIGVALESEEWNATRLAKTRVALRGMMHRIKFFFINVVVQL